MAKPPEKKPEPAKPTDVRVLPMELRIADRFTDATGEWEVITRPYVSAGGKLASAHVRKIGRPETTDLRTWSAHERIAVKRGRLSERRARHRRAPLAPVASHQPRPARTLARFPLTEVVQSLWG